MTNLLSTMRAELAQLEAECEARRAADEAERAARLRENLHSNRERAAAFVRDKTGYEGTLVWEPDDTDFRVPGLPGICFIGNAKRFTMRPDHHLPDDWQDDPAYEEWWEWRVNAHLDKRITVAEYDSKRDALDAIIEMADYVATLDSLDVQPRYPDPPAQPEPPTPQWYRVVYPGEMNALANAGIGFTVLHPAAGGYADQAFLIQFDQPQMP